MCEINKFALVVDPIRPHPPIISDSPSQIVDTTDNVLITEKKSTQDLVQNFDMWRNFRFLYIVDVEK